MPTQNHSVCGKKIPERLKMKVSQITLRWAGLKVWNVCKNPAIVHGRVRYDIEKQMNEELRQMKNNNKNEEQKWNEEQHWRTKMNNNNKNLPRGSPRQNTIAGSFWVSIKKNDYRSIISIIFMSDIVFHLVAI